VEKLDVLTLIGSLDSRRVTADVAPGAAMGTCGRSARRFHESCGSYQSCPSYRNRLLFWLWFEMAASGTCPGVWKIYYYIYKYSALFTTKFAKLEHFLFQIFALADDFISIWVHLSISHGWNGWCGWARIRLSVSSIFRGRYFCIPL